MQKRTVKKSATQNTFAVIEVDTGKIRDRFGGMGIFKGGLRGNERVNSVIISEYKRH